MENIAELDVVAIRRDFVSETANVGRTIPSGSTGTVVAVLGNGEAFLIEFITPFQAFATVKRDDVLLACD